MASPPKVRRSIRQVPRSVAIAGAVVAVLGVLVGLLHDRGGTEPPRRPHIVLVVVDTLRADALGMHGSPHPTPRLDRLAAESVVFTNAIAASTWTLPSMASLMTSLQPSEHGLLGGGGGGAEGDGEDAGETGGEAEAHLPQVLDAGFVTLAEALQGGGYRTIGIVNQVYLRWKFGFGQGFEFFEGLRGHDGFKINQRFGEVLDGKGVEPGTLLAAEGRPSFVYLHYLDPHWPYIYRLEAEGEPLPAGLEAADSDPGLPRSPDATALWVEEQEDPELRRRGLDNLSARYALEVQWVDAAIGNLVDQLQSRGLWDDTLLVVTSDHGEGFWEHAELLHGYAPYEEQIHVPLLIRPPSWMGLPSGRREAPVGLIDLMPTLLDLAGIPALTACRGRSLVAALRGDEDAERAILIETARERALRTAGAKLLLRRDLEPETVEVSKEVRRVHSARLEFYDLTTDPTELRNLATPCEGSCRDSFRRLREMEQSLAASAGSSRSSTVTPDEIEELRALGYIGD